MPLPTTAGPKQSSSNTILGTTTWGTRLALLTLITLLAAGLSFADGKHKLSKDLDALKGGHAGDTVDVIIQFNQTPTAAHHQKVQNKGGVLKTKLDFIKGAHYTVPVDALDDLANDPDVVYISPDREVRGSLDYTTSAVGAPTAWNVYRLTGTGIGVAIIDSGIHNNNDFNSGPGQNRIVYSQDFVGGAGPAADDLYGHGTHVAGIVGSGGRGSACPNCTRSFKGVAPNVNLINLRVLDQNGSSTDSRVISAIQKAIWLQNTYNIEVINLSLGRGVFESYHQDPLCQAVEQAWNAGIVVVVAAGNDGRDNSAGTNGYGTIAAPGNDPYVITVGAMKTNGTYSTTDDTIATYSSKGPTGYDQIVKPDLVAPGNQVVSDSNPGSTLWMNNPSNLVPLKYYQNPPNAGTSNQYFTLSGTSMATPVVSGAAALLLQQYPNLTPDQVKARLMKTASKAFPASSTATDPTTGITYTDYYDIFTVGAGYLNIPAALANNDLANGSAMSPSVTFDPGTQTVSLVNGTSVLWGTSVVWGNSVVWGDSLVWGTSVVWGDSVVLGSSVVWGDSTCSGFSVVWGTGVVWGTSSNQSTSTAQSLMVTGEN
jgi:serine protease AprX